MSLTAIHETFTQACKDHEAQLLKSVPGGFIKAHASVLAHSTMGALFSLLANPPATPKIDGMTKDGLLRSLLQTLHLSPGTIEAIMRLDTSSSEFRQYVQGLDAPLQ